MKQKMLATEIRSLGQEGRWRRQENYGQRCVRGCRPSQGRIADTRWFIKSRREGLVVGGGVVISRVVVSLFVGDSDVTVELQLGIGGVGGVLVITVVRGESEAGLEKG